MLTRGIGAFSRGDRSTSYRMMRYRILFQGGVVLLMIGAMFLRKKPYHDPAEGRLYTVNKQAFLEAAHEYRVQDGRPIVNVVAASATEADTSAGRV